MCAVWWGRARLSGGRGGKEEEQQGDQSKHHSCNSSVRPSWSFLLFGPGVFRHVLWHRGSQGNCNWPAGHLSLTPEDCALSLERQGQETETGRDGRAVGHLLVPHLVGLDEAHKDWEEDRGRSRLGALSEVVHHIVKGFLELEKEDSARVEAACVNTVEAGVATGCVSEVTELPASLLSVYFHIYIFFFPSPPTLRFR